MLTGWIFIDRKTGQWRRESRGRVSGFIWGLWRAYGARILCYGFHTDQSRLLQAEYAAGAFAKSGEPDQFQPSVRLVSGLGKVIRCPCRVLGGKLHATRLF